MPPGSHVPRTSPARRVVHAHTLDGDVDDAAAHRILRPLDGFSMLMRWCKTGLRKCTRDVTKSGRIAPAKPNMTKYRLPSQIQPSLEARSGLSRQKDLMCTDPFHAGEVETLASLCSFCASPVATYSVCIDELDTPVSSRALCTWTHFSPVYFVYLLSSSSPTTPTY